MSETSRPHRQLNDPRQDARLFYELLGTFSRVVLLAG